MGRLQKPRNLSGLIVLGACLSLGPLAALTAHGASTSLEFIQPLATWKFLDDGSDPGTLWRFAVFNDNGWRIGPGQFGYGEGDEASSLNWSAPAYVAHYFRHKFTVSRPADFTNLLFRVLRDDGVVVYLNGHEVFRMNMPDGPVDGSTPAASVVMIVDENTYFPTNIGAARLVPGTNIVAVELHQTAGSTDGSFDLSLTGVGPAQSVRLLTERQ